MQRKKAIGLVLALGVALAARQVVRHDRAALRSATIDAAQVTLTAGKKPKPDPIEANGAVFEGWPKPDAALVFTGEQWGYLEPCGCAGLENMKGGLKRRHTFLKQLAKDGWAVAAIDVGGQVRDERQGPQNEIKSRRLVESLMKLGYRAINLGAPELKTEIIGVALNLDPATNPLVSANVALLDFDDQLSKQKIITQVGPYKIGVTGVVSDSKDLAALAKIDDLVMRTPEEGLDAVLPDLKAAKCDSLVLLVYGTIEQAEALAKKYPVFQWVVAAKGADEPPDRPRPIEGTKSYLVEIGHKGLYAVTIGLYKQGDKGFRYQKVPMDHRYEDSPAMIKMMGDYQEELRSLGFEGLGVKTAVHPSGGEFAGSEACQDCHTSAWEVFEQTPHFTHSWESITTGSEPSREFDPECLSCHVTGWEPQKFFPFQSGFVSMKETAHLAHQGCENCHGPAAKHVAVENGDLEVTEEEQKALQQALHMEILPNEGNKDGQEFDKGKVVQSCMQCHDLDNSPDFDFQQYWKEVEHHGKD